MSADEWRGKHITKAGPWLRWMLGRAFIDRGAGVIADVYYGTIEELVLLYPIAGAEQVLGYSMAHELGHLLIGPGHRRHGIMLAPWGNKELDQINRHQLQFDEAERDTILRTLRSRAAGSGAASGHDQPPIAFPSVMRYRVGSSNASTGAISPIMRDHQTRRKYTSSV